MTVHASKKTPVWAWLVLVLGGVFAILVYVWTPTSYEATARIDSNTRLRLPDYVELAMSENFVNAAGQLSGKSPESVRESVLVSQVATYPALSVRSSALTPIGAVNLSNLVATSLVDEVAELEASSKEVPKPSLDIRSLADESEVESSESGKLLTSVSLFAAAGFSAMAFRKRKPHARNGDVRRG